MLLLLRLLFPHLHPTKMCAQAIVHDAAMESYKNNNRFAFSLSRSLFLPHSN